MDSSEDRVQVASISVRSEEGGRGVPKVAPAPPVGPAPASEGLSERVRALRLPVPEEPQTGLGRRLPWVLTILFMGTTVLVGYWAWVRDSQPQPTAQPAGPDSPPGLLPFGPQPAPKEGEIVLQSKGYIVAKHQILISPLVSGRILRLNCDEGQRVQKGELLVELESTEYEAEYKRALANVEAAKQRYQELQRYRDEEIRQAEAELAEVQHQLAQAEDDWRRAQDLFGRGIITQQEHDNARRQAEALRQRANRMKAALELLQKGPREERRQAALAELQAAQAELARAKWRLDNCKIYAPITGTILKKNAEQWNLVNPLAMQGSYSICEMADLSQLEVELMIQERDIAKIFEGQLCKVYAEAYPEDMFPDRVYAGRISRLMPIADRAKGAIPVRVEFRVPPEEQGKYLKPEMGAMVTFYNAQAPKELPIFWKDVSVPGAKQATPTASTASEKTPPPK
ncbi:MAG: efflux RND transporter periplasmic adaptor subunit [Thermoguttaceae bacterium]|nr:efflux RND transporter periplasmic adaptor subunit [Thermoguttaceae bacterium]MDW8037127.1 efflux RND transporter periplasmic adaptor subunit [Thermoguttaceae bacterium]